MTALYSSVKFVPRPQRGAAALVQAGTMNLARGPS
jgi:hypothetical protein